MAVTKIHPIKSTLKKALDYIENPDKTYDEMLVSSFACSYETADIEFEMLLAQAYQKGNNLAHHLIQSFAPGKATPEQAHEIGRQLADEVLQGKYPYVLTTHIDKGHVHNHIIFCAVDMVNQRKYISNKQSYAYIRRTSDEAAAALKAMEHRLADMAVLIKNVTTYKQLRLVSMEYRKAKDKAQFRREHESTLILYEAAAKALKEQGVKKLPDLYALKAEYKRLAEEKERLYEQYGEAKKRMQEYGIIKQNVDGILRVKPGKEWTQEL